MLMDSRARAAICSHITPIMSATRFIKMHGLGNDFVVIDARQQPFPLDDARARAMVGFVL
jgi:hypothetical protein